MWPSGCFNYLVQWRFDVLASHMSESLHNLRRCSRDRVASEHKSSRDVSVEAPQYRVLEVSDSLRIYILAVQLLSIVASAGQTGFLFGTGDDCQPSIDGRRGTNGPAYEPLSGAAPLGVDLSVGYLPYLAGWREVGCKALERSPQLVPDAVELRRVLKSEVPDWIPGVFSKMFEGGRSIAEHLASMREQIEGWLDASPLFINARSGSDAWTLDEAEELYLRSAELEAELGVALSHETHRAR
jgi:hypothetical protein